MEFLAILIGPGLLWLFLRPSMGNRYKWYNYIENQKGHYH